MVKLATRDGPLQVPDATVRAVARHAERQADLTAAYLDATGLFNGKPVQLPAAFLPELAAVLELGLWERQDLRRHLDVDIPSFSEAAASLAARAAKGKKRTLNKIAGGLVTWGAASPPIEIYRGPTGPELQRPEALGGCRTG
jgi:hypothetical protein